MRVSLASAVVSSGTKQLRQDTAFPSLSSVSHWVGSIPGSLSHHSDFQELLA